MDIEVYIQKPAKVGVYTGFSGSRSTQVADASVTYHGLVVPCTIWARFNRDRDTGEESITIEPGLPKGVKFEDDDDLVEFREVVMSSAQATIGYATMEERAITRLTEPKAIAASTAGRKILRGEDIKPQRQADTQQDNAQ